MDTTTITIEAYNIDYETAGHKAERTAKKLAEEYAKRLGSFKTADSSKPYVKGAGDHE